MVKHTLTLPNAENLAPNAANPSPTLAHEKFPWRTFNVLTVFAIAMGFLETAIVVCLRKLYYPEGFRFPLSSVHPDIALTEFLREAATILMLWGVGQLAGRNKPERLAYFLHAFAVWDIFYYVFLKLLLGWPESWLTWDILFLLPLPWVGPVWAPVLLSCTMIRLAVVLLRNAGKGKAAQLSKLELRLFLAGSLTVIFSFILDYYLKVIGNFTGTQLMDVMLSREMLRTAMRYSPQDWYWEIFLLGEGIIVAGVWLYWQRLRVHQGKATILSEL